MKRIAILFLILHSSLFVLHTQAQSYRDFIRRGNRLYRDSIYDKSQVLYQKGYEKDSLGTEVNYNLGNALLMQEQAKEAMRMYERAAKQEHDKARRHQIFHNIGFVLQGQKQFGPAIEAYKEALRCDPTDHETRYNLVLCQRQLKSQQQDQQNQQGDNQEDKQDKQDQQKQEQKQDQQQQQKKEEPKPNQPQEGQMSRENAEQMLNAAMQNERQTQDKVKKQMQEARPRRLLKQW